MKEINIRRSVRQFEDKKVEEDKIIKILKAAMQAPSARNQQPWEFIVIEDKERISKLTSFTPHYKFAAKAPLLILVLVKQTDLLSEDFVQQDLGACIQNLMLEAVSENLGSTWMGLYPREDRIDFFSKTLNIDKSKVLPFALIGVGYPKEEGLNKFTDRFDESRIHREVY